jgi:hypothetical protein
MANKPNLFAAAKTAAPAKPAKAQKEVVKIDSIASDLERLAQVQEQIDALTAEAKLLTETVKTESITAFVELYEKKASYPGSFEIEAGKASMLFIPMDKYITINEERASELASKYGEEIVEEQTTYTMDAALVEKYGEEISSLIMKSKKISEEDKMKLIGATVKYAVKKGTISVITDKFADFGVDEVVMDVKPVFSMKNVKIA